MPGGGELNSLRRPFQGRALPVSYPGLGREWILRASHEAVNSASAPARFGQQPSSVSTRLRRALAAQQALITPQINRPIRPAYLAPLNFSEQRFDAKLDSNIRD